MARIIIFVIFLVFRNLAASQDLVITNARILDGTGAVIERGSIVVSDQRIVSVFSSIPALQNLVHIDARGMTVMPGLIDTHRPLFPSQGITSNQAMNQWPEYPLARELRNYLAAGITAILSTGDYYPAITGALLLRVPRLSSNIFTQQYQFERVSNQLNLSLY